jgi:DNA primase
LITQATIQKIQDYARIDEVVGDFLTLKRSGANYKACCPFHDEKSPSFMVSPAKNIFKCFGCGKSGDPIHFVMEHERLSYPEALKYLAGRYNIEIEETFDSAKQVEDKLLTEQLYEVMEFAKQYFIEQLIDTVDGKAIGLSYYKKRGFLDITIQKFSLGYAPDGGDTFYKAAIQKGYSADILEKAGLVKNINSRYIDFFRGRVMFPIPNVAGKVVAFGGRIMGNAEKQPKYINSPETEIYVKSKLVYGIFSAKSEIRKHDSCLLVEGYTDVIALAQNSIQNVVASSGTALTVEQLRLIKRFTQNLLIIYDGDSAGKKAAMRGLDLALEEELNVRIVLLPDGHDPDSYVNKVGGEAFQTYIQDNAQDFISFMANLLFKDSGNDPIKRSEAVKQILQSIAHVHDMIKATYYIKICSDISQVPEAILLKELNKAKKNLLKRNQHAQEDNIQIPEQDVEPLVDDKLPINNLYLQELDIIRVMFEYGDKKMDNYDYAVEYIAHELGEGNFVHESLQKIYTLYLDYFEKGKDFSFIQNQNNYPKELQNSIIDSTSEMYALSPNWQTKHQIFIKSKAYNYKSDITSAVGRILMYRFMTHIKSLDESIKIAFEEKEEETLNRLLAEKGRFQKELRILANTLGTVVMRY